MIRETLCLPVCTGEQSVFLYATKKTSKLFRTRMIISRKVSYDWDMGDLFNHKNVWYTANNDYKKEVVA